MEETSALLKNLEKIEDLKLVPLQHHKDTSGLNGMRKQFAKRIEEYSEGQKKKVLIARSLCQPAHLYVWDEPLNYVDIFSRMQIEELIRHYKPTMLLVEHDKYL